MKRLEELVLDQTLGDSLSDAIHAHANARITGHGKRFHLGSASTAGETMLHQRVNPERNNSRLIRHVVLYA